MRADDTVLSSSEHPYVEPQRSGRRIADNAGSERKFALSGWGDGTLVRGRRQSRTGHRLAPMVSMGDRTGSDE
jgi:hypothetical protein